ncbi:Protein spinster [Papilio machaon]|uniref:Protein spinster n=1 Tax=Papilio machaon TaxID=76193 RepID=A0A194QSF9_PAPMA|nr:Protein spinster [Papilio machaon]
MESRALIGRRAWRDANTTYGVLSSVVCCRSSVLADVKSEFNIGDDWAGLLQTVFVIAYMVFAPMFGYLGDRYSRRKIMAAGVALWTMTTFAGSYVTNYYWFAVFRGLVGIGEASYSTIAPTIISDLFVGNVRSKMLAFFYFAIPVGSGFGYIVGSVAGAIAGDWRWGLRVTPVLGAAAVILVAFVMLDPERGQAEESTMKPTSYGDDLRALVKNPSFMLSTLAFTCVAFVTGALAWWGPLFIYLGLNLQPGVAISKESVSFKFGIVGMLAGACGVPAGAALAQRLRARVPHCDPLVCGLALLASAPLVYLALIAVSAHVAPTYLLMFLGMFTLNLTWSIVADVVLVSAPTPTYRTKVIPMGATVLMIVLIGECFAHHIIMPELYARRVACNYDHC